MSCKCSSISFKRFPSTSTAYVSKRLRAAAVPGNTVGSTAYGVDNSTIAEANRLKSFGLARIRRQAAMMSSFQQWWRENEVRIGILFEYILIAYFGWCRKQSVQPPQRRLGAPCVPLTYPVSNASNRSSSGVDCNPPCASRSQSASGVASETCVFPSVHARRNGSPAPITASSSFGSLSWMT